MQILTDIAERASAEGYRGCPFVNVSVEFPDRTHAARVFVESIKTSLLERLQEVSIAAGAKDPISLAKSISLLMDGAYAASQSHSAENSVIKSAPNIARILIADACS